MNTKDLVSILAQQNNLSEKEVNDLLQITVGTMTDELINGKAISVKGFGVFELRKKNERITVHPVSGDKMMIPPKLTLNFKQSSILKDKLKGEKSL